MARVTVEDCLQFVEGDRFKLVHEAVKLIKKHQLKAEGRHKPAVIALKEIAEGRHDFTHEEVS